MFRPARRSEAKPLVVLYAPSGAGKTLSALLLARGFAGPKGRVGMIETESGRGEAYADDPRLAPGYDVFSIRDTFGPEKYAEAIREAAAAKLDALVIDSGSHEWNAAGGVLDLAAQNQSAGKKGVLVWQQPKMQHQKNFVLPLLTTPIPLVILCLRAKYPMIEKKDASGKKEWIRSEELEPTQADDILFEAFVHGWIDREHRLHVTKLTRADLSTAIYDGEPITIETGARLAAWSRGDAVPAADDLDAEIETALRAAAQRGADDFKAEWKSLHPKYQHKFNALKDELKAKLSA